MSKEFINKASKLGMAECLAEDSQLMLGLADRSYDYLQRAEALGIDGFINDMRDMLALAARSALLAANYLAGDFIEELEGEEDEDGEAGA